MRWRPQLNTPHFSPTISAKCMSYWVMPFGLALTVRFDTRHKTLSHDGHPSKRRSTVFSRTLHCDCIIQKYCGGSSSAKLASGDLHNISRRQTGLGQCADCNVNCLHHLALRRANFLGSSMLYHLITLNPHKDIMLHVSINNPAVVCP